MSAPAAFGWVLLVTFTFIVLRTLVVTFHQAASDDLVSGFWCQLIAYSLGLFCILRVYAPQRSIRDFLGLRGTSVAIYPMALVFGAAIVSPANALYDAVSARFPSPIPDTLSEVFHDASPVRRALIGAVLVVFGPILEEILFRGALLRPLKRKVGPISGAVFTGILFALVHLEWQVLPPFILLGIALGLLRNWSGSTIPGMLVHATFNGAALIELVRAARGSQEVHIPLWASLVSAAVALATLVVIRAVSRKSSVAVRAREVDA